ncbi:hypothetical protein MP228_000717 [Amoeboaphelidium protococcarum]|nr:hypothetical protein MP228_000717 [Amoeboaphelidium protococcarum]
MDYSTIRFCLRKFEFNNDQIQLHPADELFVRNIIHEVYGEEKSWRRRLNEIKAAVTLVSVCGNFASVITALIFGLCIELGALRDFDNGQMRFSRRVLLFGSGLEMICLIGILSLLSLQVLSADCEDKQKILAVKAITQLSTLNAFEQFKLWNLKRFAEYCQSQSAVLKRCQSPGEMVGVALNFTLSILLGLMAPVILHFKILTVRSIIEMDQWYENPSYIGVLMAFVISLRSINQRQVGSHQFARQVRFMYLKRLRNEVIVKRRKAQTRQNFKLQSVEDFEQKIDAILIDQLLVKDARWFILANGYVGTHETMIKKQNL